jgi:hypothetical protein
MPTPTSASTSVTSAKPGIGIEAPVRSANETPAAEATAANAVVAADATAAATRPCFHTVGRAWAAVTAVPLVLVLVLMLVLMLVLVETVLTDMICS